MGVLLYVASRLGGENGLHKSAIDVLIDLLATEHSVATLSQARCQLPQIDGRSLGTPKWFLTGSNSTTRFSLTSRFLIDLAIELRNKIAKFRLRKSLLKLDPDLILVNGLANHTYWQNIAHNSTAKKVLIIRSSPRHCQKPMPRTIEWSLAAMQQYHGFIFVSSHCQREWMSYEVLKDKQSYYIPNCCQEDVAESLVSQDSLKIRQKLKIPEHKLIVVCVASLQPRKGQDLLLDRLSEFIAIAPNLKLYLVGPIAFPSAWTECLLNKIADKSLSERVEYVGTRTDAMDFIYAADILVLPSRAEAMPRVVLEAMALKTPVIAADVDGIPELIEHETTGLLFSHERSQGLVDGFKRMATNPSFRELLAERAYQKYWSNFSRKNQINRYSEFVKTMIGV